MSLSTRVDFSECSPSQLWAALDSELRLLAARSLYAHDWGESPVRHEADAAIMTGMRFRPAAVRQLPADKRAHYLARSVRPSDSLSGSLLLALHLEERRPLLAAFLDAVEIPHSDGLIAEDYEPKPPGEKVLKKACDALRSRFPEAEVDTYLASLYVLDRTTWARLGALLGARSGEALRR